MLALGRDTKGHIDLCGEERSHVREVDLLEAAADGGGGGVDVRG